jgi:hypothetical protein
MFSLFTLRVKACAEELHFSSEMYLCGTFDATMCSDGNRLMYRLRVWAKIWSVQIWKLVSRVGAKQEVQGALVHTALQTRTGPVNRTSNIKKLWALNQQLGKRFY